MKTDTGNADTGNADTGNADTGIFWRADTGNADAANNPDDAEMGGGGAAER